MPTTLLLPSPHPDFWTFRHLCIVYRIDPLVISLVTFLDDVGDDSESRTSMFCFVVCVVVVPFCLFVCCTANARLNGLF